MVYRTRRKRKVRTSRLAMLPAVCGLAALAALSCLVRDVQAVQVPLAGSSSGDDAGVVLDPASTTLVDLISQDKDLSLFMRLVQHARLVPTLNRLRNATVFAPTNAAISSQSWLLDMLPDELEVNEEAETDTMDPPHDNLNYRLRERLFYHMLNYSWTPPAVASSNADTPGSPIASYETTLFFPTTHEEHGRPGHVPYPEPADTLLGGEGQKLAVVVSPKDSSGRKDSVVRIGVNELGEGGASIVPSRGGSARNGKLVVVDKLLHPPKSLSHQLRYRSCLSKDTLGEVGQDDEDKPYDGPSLAKIASLLTPELWNNLTERSHLTLFAPRDEAFNVLDPLEWRYLTSGFAGDDILEIASNHESTFDGGHRQKIGYLDRLLTQKDVALVSGNSVTIDTNPDGKPTVNGSVITQPNILASNGVMHIVDSLLLPHGSLALTPEKYLLALNATRFVSLFRNAELSHLLQSSPRNPANNASYTILATKDDTLERYTSQPWQTLPPEGSKELKEALQYHILEGRWTKKQLEDGALLKTMLQTEDLDGQHQRMPVSVTKTHDGDIGFGTASVISDPIEAGGSIIYLVSRIVEPPSSFVSTALDKGLSTFVASVYASAMDKELIKHSPATTFLAPTNAAFDYLGLAMNYFLLSSAQEELARLLSYHSIKGIVYLDDIAYDSEHYPTLEGTDIFLEQSKNASHVKVRGPRIGGFPANGDNRDARVTEGDLLTSTGVLHVLDQVELPASLNITAEKLMRGAKATTFLDLLRQANMSWVAEGRSAPAAFWLSSPYINLSKSDKSKIRKRFFQRDSYTVLCPTDKAFTRINLTHYLDNEAALVALVQQHILPSPPPSKGSLSDPTKFPSDGKPIALEDDRSFASLLSKSEGGTSKYGDLTFRKAGESDWLVGIKGARGTDGTHDAARIINFGRNTPRFSKSDDDGKDDASITTDEARTERSTKMVFGGGVLLIDAVLEPYAPGWFQRWGWIVLLVVLCLAGTTCIALLGWKLWDRRKQHAAQYEAVPQDNEED